MTHTLGKANIEDVESLIMQPSTLHFLLERLAPAGRTAITLFPA